MNAKLTIPSWQRLFALVSVAATLLAPSAVWAGRAEGPVVSVGDKAPGFFLTTINPEASGMRRVVLKNLFDDEATKGVVISFFATWCAPCKKELPVLQKFWKAYGDQGLRIIVVSIDKEKEAVESLSGFIEHFGLTFPVVSDRFNLLARRYLGTTTALPSLFIIDGDGVIKSIHQSYDDDAAVLLEKELTALLGITPEQSVLEEMGDVTGEGPSGEAAAETSTPPSARPKARVKKKKTGRKKNKAHKAARGS